MRHPAFRHVFPAASVTVAFLATALAYWSGLYGGFVFDDFPNLVYSDRWRIDIGDRAHWRRLLSSDISGPLGRPLASASFAFNYAASGLDAFWFKLTNLLIHLMNGALVWLLCQSLFRNIPIGPRPGRWVTVVVAAAWLLHPLQVSAVLYVVQRMEIGAQLGVLLALLAYSHARHAQLTGRAYWPWLVAAALAMLFGLGFKESALLAPLFAFLIELCVFRFAGRNQRRSRGWVAAYAAGILAGLGLYFAVLPTFINSDGYVTRGFTAAERLLTQLPVLVMYLRQIVLPLPESLTFFYDNFPVSKGWLQPPATFYSAVVLAGVAGAAAAAWRRWPLTSLGIGWFFAGHALTSNVVPLELVFEHRNYLALLGILLALVQPLCALGTRTGLNADARAVLAVVPVIALAALCAIQAATWGDPLRLAWTLENRNPTSARAVYGLGSALLDAARGDRDAPGWSMARGQFERALTLPGGAALAGQGLIVMHGHAGQPVPHGVWGAFRDSVTREPLDVHSTSALHAVSQCHIQGRCGPDYGDLLATFIQVLIRNPDSAIAHTLYADFAWNVLEDRDLAIRMQRKAVSLEPDDISARIALSKFLLATGRPAHRAEAARLITHLRAMDTMGRWASERAELEQAWSTAGGSDGT